MSKTSFLFVVFVLLVLFVLFVLFFSSGRPTPIKPLAPQEKSGGEIDVTITPEVLIVGQSPRFKLEFNTHSVELDFDVSKVGELSDESGKINKESIWEGSPSGGHHRSGTLTFPAPLSETKTITLTIRDIAGVSRREFTWQL